MPLFEHGYRLRRRPVSFFIAFLLALLCVFPGPRVLADPVDDLIEQALARNLHEDPYWLLLGHYRARMTGGYASMIDDPAFFFDPQGKHDPRRELIATLRAFFAPASDDPAIRHPVCRFPARLAWLREQLGFDAARMPVPTCEIYDQVYQHLQPRSVALIFPAAYMNSPASMFGHTLLVFDSKDKNRLLAKGVGYAATVTTGFGPVFAFGGIFGLYPGRYTVESYSDKVEQYNDIHRRDIWEYELDFTQEEVDRMFRHTWELQNIWSWYYFFDENCAYKLYQLLDAGRPSLNLSDDPTWFVIPIDTVKRIAGKGIVRDTAFRPSKSTRMKQLADHLPRDVRRRALATARGSAAPEELAEDTAVPEAERRIALDLSADYAQYLFTEKKLAHEAYTKRFLGILRARSKLGPRQDEEFALLRPSRPEDGHAAAMMAPGVAIENGEGALTLSGRVAYHGLLDNDAGFTRGAQIFFLNSEARWFPDEDRFSLRFVDVVNVESIAPRDDLFQPSSWRARIGFTQMDRRDDQDGMVFIVQTGSGAAWEPNARHLAFTMVEAEIHAADRYRSFVAAGPGFALGWLYTPAERIKVLSRARSAWIYERDADWWRVEAQTGIDLKVSQERSVRVYYQYTRNDDYDVNEANLAFNLYF